MINEILNEVVNSKNILLEVYQDLKNSVHNYFKPKKLLNLKFYAEK